MTATATVITAQQVYESPEEFGITWQTEEVKHKGITMTGPIVRIVDLQKALRWLTPENFLGMADGQSFRVQAQDVCRTLKWADRGTTDETIVVATIKRWMGQRRGARGKITPALVGLDGKRYTEKVELDAANLAHLVDSGIPADLARKALGLAGNEAEEAAEE